MSDQDERNFDWRQNLCNVGESSSFRGNVEIGWSMAQFPTDSGFIDRASRFSLFGSGGGFSEMINHQEIGSGSNLVVKDDASKVAEDSQSSGAVKCVETSSSMGFKKRKRTLKDTEPDQSHREGEEGKKEDELSPNPNGNKTNNDGYIHMRARRGQATNSHSIAERIRREKISERMKFLQDLVPGCDKVTGKAVMLDEIINYVQSLQCQIEFLSMKLSAVNPLLDSNLESLRAKDAFQLPAPTFPQSMSMLYPPPSYLPQTGFMQTHLSSVSSFNGELKRQETHGYENDQHNVVHVNHGTGTEPDHEDQTANTQVKL